MSTRGLPAKNPFEHNIPNLAMPRYTKLPSHLDLFLFSYPVLVLAFNSSSTLSSHHCMIEASTGVDVVMYLGLRSPTNDLLLCFARVPR